MKIKVNIPTHWNQLNRIQLERLALLFGKPMRGRVFDVRVLMVLLHMRWWQFRKLYKAIILLKQVPLTELKKSYAFVYEDTNRTKFIEVLRIGTKKYYAPQNKLFNLTVEEFAMADDLYFKLRSAKTLAQQKELLAVFAAVLYVPTHNKQRGVFARPLMLEAAKPFKKVPLRTLLAIKLCYEGSRYAITKRFKKAFPATAPTKAEKRKAPTYGFAKVILQMAGGKFGNYEETKRTPLFTFLEEFEEQLKRAS